jgi:hypothetical protein
MKLISIDVKEMRESELNEMRVSISSLRSVIAERTCPTQELIDYYKSMLYDRESINTILSKGGIGDIIELTKQIEEIQNRIQYSITLVCPNCDTKLNFDKERESLIHLRYGKLTASELNDCNKKIRDYRETIKRTEKVNELINNYDEPILSVDEINSLLIEMTNLKRECELLESTQYNLDNSIFSKRLMKLIGNNKIISDVIESR